MRKHVCVLTTSAAILAFGAIAASAQAPAPPTNRPPAGSIAQSPSGAAPNIQPPSAAAPVPKLPSAAAPIPQPPSAPVPPLQPSLGGYPRGMMGRGLGEGGWRRGALGPGARGSIITEMIFALMDTDGDGKLSLQEWQTAQERIFKAMDSDKDGFVSLQEMEDFMRGAGTRFPPSRE